METELFFLTHFKNIKRQRRVDLLLTGGEMRLEQKTKCCEWLCTGRAKKGKKCLENFKFFVVNIEFMLV